MFRGVASVNISGGWSSDTASVGDGRTQCRKDQALAPAGPFRIRTGFAGSSLSLGVSQVFGHFLSCQCSCTVLPFAVFSAELCNHLKSVGLYFFIKKKKKN